MKRLLLSLSFILLSVSSFAQKIQFGNITNKWQIYDSTVGCCIPVITAYNTVRYDSITVNHNGHTYQYLMTKLLSALVREDAGKVYVLDNYDSTERVMYDFTLGLHDTIRTIYPGNKYVAWVTNIDSTYLQGYWYKVWHFEGHDTNTYYTDSVRDVVYNVIEGIGCTNGPFYPSNPYSVSSFSQHLYCFNNNSNITTGLSNPVLAYGWGYTNYYDNDSTCTKFYAALNAPVIRDVTNVSQLFRSEVCKVVPNPADANARIQLPSKASGQLNIFNQTGQLSFTIIFTDQDVISFVDKITAPGIYDYQITDEQGCKVYSGKFVY